MDSGVIPVARPDAFFLSRNGRQACWWGIYLFGTTVIPFAWLAWTKGVSLFTFWLVPMLPMGLAEDFSLLCENLFNRMGVVSLDFWSGASTLVGLPFAYIVFGIHYRLTSEAKTKRGFFLLILSLILLVWASLVGFAKAPPIIIR